MNARTLQVTAMVLVVLALLGVGTGGTLAVRAQEVTCTEFINNAANSPTPRFVNLNRVIQDLEAPLLARLSDTSAQYTILAPTDEAFQAMQNQVGPNLYAILMGNFEGTSRMLAYHILSGLVTTQDLEVRLNNNGNELFSLPTWQGQSVDVTRDQFFNRIYFDQYDQAAVLDWDNSNIPCSNGVIHVIDRVLVPEQATILEILTGLAPSRLNPKDFTSLNNMLLAAGPQAASLLANPNTDVTLAAPTDDAVAQLGIVEGDVRDALLSDPQRLTNLLLYHIINGSLSSQAAIEQIERAGGSGEVNTALPGATVQVAIRPDRTITINDANVITSDIDAVNGVIVVIDKVLIPPDLE